MRSGAHPRGPGRRLERTRRCPRPRCPGPAGGRGGRGGARWSSPSRPGLSQQQSLPLNDYAGATVQTSPNKPRRACGLRAKRGSETRGRCGPAAAQASPLAPRGPRRETGRARAGGAHLPPPPAPPSASPAAPRAPPGGRGSGPPLRAPGPRGPLAPAGCRRPVAGTRGRSPGRGTRGAGAESGVSGKEDTRGAASGAAAPPERVK